jgi:hypothetical protein
MTERVLCGCTGQMCRCVDKIFGIVEEQIVFDSTAQTLCVVVFVVGRSEVPSCDQGFYAPLP